MGAPVEKGPGSPSRSGGPVSCRVRVRLAAARQAPARRGARRMRVRSVAEQAAEAVVDRREQAAGEEDPRLGDRVAVGMERRRRPGRGGSRSAKKSCTSRIWSRTACGDHGVVGGLGERLDPEVDEPEPRALRHVGVGDRAEAAGAGRRRAPPRRARGTAPRLVEAGEVEVALRAEVPVEDRLGDARLAGDLGRRRAAVARCGRRRGRRRRAPPAAARSPGAGPWSRSCATPPRRACASGASSAMAACAERGAAIDARRRSTSTAATSSAWWKPFTKASGPAARRPRASSRRRPRRSRP